MTDHLSHLTLFKDVKITRDYSVVHDMSPEAWCTYLKDDLLNIEFSADIVYYRLPDDIYIECSYDNVRRSSYGVIEIARGSTTRPYFFWVDEVRLTKSATNSEIGLDTVCLKISEDIWSNWAFFTQLHDTYVERRHMPRWDSDNNPIYYPDAAQGADGAYSQEQKEVLNPTMMNQVTGMVRFRFILVNVLDSAGKMRIYVGGDAVYQNGSHSYIYVDAPTAYAHRLFDLEDILNGKFFEGVGITAENVQSIIAVPYAGSLSGALTFRSDNNVLLDTSSSAFSGFEHGSYDDIIGSHNFYREYITTKSNLTAGLDSYGLFAKYSKSISNILPEKTTSSTYDIRNEPMMFHAPARIRKVVTGMGGTIIDIPDIDAFSQAFTLRNLIELAATSLCVYVGDDIVEANAKGSVGITEALTLPIFNSAWMSYKAIQKTGDDISFNARQTATIINGVAGVGTAAATALIPGLGPAVGLLSGGSNVASGATSYFLAEKEMEAKRTTIKNSPCTVSSTGSGITGYTFGFADVYMMVLKLDPVSFAKLEEQYYYYGYFVNKTMRGTVDLHTRKKFDFIKTSGARVTGDVPGDARNTIAMIFDKGVTIYHGNNYRYIGSGMQYSNDEYSSAGAVNE